MFEWLWRRPKHHKLAPAHIRRLALFLIYYPPDEYFKEFTMALVQLKWSLPAEDAADASQVDVFDGANQVGTAHPDAGEFSIDAAPGDHSFTVVVRSKAGAQFDSDASNAAAVTVPAASVKLTAVSDLSAALA